MPRAAYSADDARLGRLYVEFQAGKGGIDTLGEFVCHKTLRLSDQLSVLDVALARGVITVEDMRNPGQQPTLQEYGLEQDRQPLYERATPIAALMGWGIGVVYAVTGMYDGPASLMYGIPAGLFIGLPGGAIGGFASLTVPTIDRLFPAGRQYWRYVQAKRLYDVLTAAAAIKSAEEDVRAYRMANGPEFERLVGRAFARRGFRVEQMGGSNDGGVDLVIQQAGVHAIVQCKAHGRPVGPAVVRELYGTLSHSDATLAVLATTNGVSKAASEWAIGKPIAFIGPDQLIRGEFPDALRQSGHSQPRDS